MSAKQLRKEFQAIEDEHQREVSDLKSQYSELVKALQGERESHTKALQEVNALREDAVQKEQDRTKETLNRADITLDSYVMSLLMDIKAHLTLNMTPEGAVLVSKIRDFEVDAPSQVFNISLIVQTVKELGRNVAAGREIPKEVYEELAKLAPKIR